MLNSYGYDLITTLSVQSKGRIVIRFVQCFCRQLDQMICVKSNL